MGVGFFVGGLGTGRFPMPLGASDTVGSNVVGESVGISVGPRVLFEEVSRVHLQQLVR